MPKNRKEKINPLDVHRERFSSFVVDLRRPKANLHSSSSISKNNSVGADFSLSPWFKGLFNKKNTSPQNFSHKTFTVPFSFHREVPRASLFRKLLSLPLYVVRQINFLPAFSLMIRKSSVFKSKKRWGLVTRKSVPQAIISTSPFLSDIFSERSKFSLFSPRTSAWTRFCNARSQIFREALRRHPILIIKQGQKNPGRAVNFFKNNFLPSHPLWSFVMVLLMIIIPFQLLAYFQVGGFAAWEGRIISSSERAVNSFLAATEAAYHQDFTAADSNFKSAGADFLAAQEELRHINDGLLFLASWSGDPKLKLAAESKKFLSAGVLASSLGANLVLATDNLFNNSEEDFVKRLDGFLYHGAAAARDAKSLKKQISLINHNNLPSPYRGQLLSLRDQANLLADSLGSFMAAIEKFKEALGLSHDKRYLLVFQNNAEMRASGGFLGSYALVDVRNGAVRNLEVPAGGSYDVEAGRRVLVVAPEPLWLVNPLWRFWDANWWPDWPTTAKNLMWFYEKSGGPSVDGVISFTPTVIEHLLTITGPIDLSAEYGLIIDADNFWETVQKVVEKDNLLLTHPEDVQDLPSTSEPINSVLPLKQDLDVNVDNKPKKIIGDLMARLLEVLPQKLDQENLIRLFSVFEDSLTAKHILFYFNDPILQAEVAARNWAGEIREQAGDYLLLVHSNIAGQKSDRLMKEKIEHNSEIRPDGSILVTLKIVRTHTGQKRVALTGVRNVDWLRVYVPAGSQLVSAEGWRSPDPEYLQEKPEAGWENIPLLSAERAAVVDSVSGTKIYQENNKTVFANWLMVDPGESETVTLRYLLPFNFSELAVDRGWRERLNSWFNPEAKEFRPYSLLVQKQPGAYPSDFVSRLSWSTDWRVAWSYPDNLSVNNSSWAATTALTGDKYFTVLLEKNN